MGKTDEKTMAAQTVANGEGVGVKTPFYIFPGWRMDRNYPWVIWAVGWLSIFKAVLWLSTNPGIQDPQIELLAAKLAVKFLITTVPFLILGIGVWNLRKWAIWGLIALCVADLIFFLVTPGSTRFIAGNHFILLSITLLIFNGPLGNILILLATPVLIKYSGKTETFSQTDDKKE